MQAEDLVAEEVLPVAEGGGDSDGPRCAEGREFIGAPWRSLVWPVAPLVDFDPDVAGVALEGRAAAGALGDVGHDGTGVGGTPLVPLQFTVWEYVSVC